jgi:hypothetical protein
MTTTDSEYQHIGIASIPKVHKIKRVKGLRISDAELKKGISTLAFDTESL